MVAASADLRRAGREPRLTPAAGSLLRTDVPITAAAHGAAVGWGMELALTADIGIASEQAKFGDPFVKRGLCCDVAGGSTPAPTTTATALPPSSGSVQRTPPAAEQHPVGAESHDVVAERHDRARDDLDDDAVRADAPDDERMAIARRFGNGG